MAPCSSRRQRNDGLYRVSQDGGAVERVTQVDSSRHEEHLGPHFLPDGRHFLFTVRSDAGVLGIHLGSLNGSRAKLLIKGASNGFYTRPRGSSQSYILFERNMVLMAQRFDQDRQQVFGEPLVVSSKQLTFWRAFSASENGVLAYRAGSPDSVLVWMNREGKTIQTLPVKGDYRQISLSPDESMVALGKMETESSNISYVWLMELSRGTLSRLTSVPPNDWLPVWSPDGRRIAFSSSRDGPFNLYVRAATGAGADEALLKSGVAKWALVLVSRRPISGVFVLRIRKPRSTFGFFPSPAVNHFRFCRRNSTKISLRSLRMETGSPTPPMSLEVRRYMCGNSKRDRPEAAPGGSRLQAVRIPSGDVTERNSSTSRRIGNLCR